MHFHVFFFPAWISQNQSHSFFFSFFLHLLRVQMGKKGTNSKAEAANAKKAAAKAEKDKVKAAANEAAESAKWSQGAKKNKKDLEEEKKVK